MAPDHLIYLDNAATSWPKPPDVAAAMSRFLTEVGANPGRSGHRLSIAAGRIVEDTREAVADLFSIDDPFRVVFGSNATEALNLALRGLIQPGDHVVTSSVEHNSVMRPLRALETQGVQVTVVSCSPEGELNPEDLQSGMRPNTRLIILNHASNVCGTILPIRKAGLIAHRHGALLLVDTAATAGLVELDMAADNIDLLAFTGHKALMGPTGTGGLVLGPGLDPADISPLVSGGTGSRSEQETQPDFLPDRFESGTCNVTGLAGLHAGIRWRQERGLIGQSEQQTVRLQEFIDELSSIAGVHVFGTGDSSRQISTIALNIDGLSPSEAGLMLDREYGVLCRVGLHCSPAAHRTLGTYPIGTLRFALGPFTTEDDLQQTLAAVRKLATVGGQ